MSPSSRSAQSSRAKTILAYAVMVAATVAAFLWIRRFGAGLTAPPPPPGELAFGSSSNAATVDVLLHVLLALVVVILAARIVGTMFSWIGQPPVIGEVVAGIMLGPSLLGRLWPAATDFVLPDSVAPFLQTVAQVGVILYIFIVGMELDTRRLRQDTHSTVAISHASIILPFVLGSLLAIWLYPRLSTADVPFTIFALFLGVSMSVTAFPVLARILTDRGLHRTPLGVTALSCAAVDDATAWCLLAFVTGVAKARTGGAVYTVTFTVAFIAVMIVVVRPLFVRLADRAERSGELSQRLTTVIILAMLLSALITESIGIHALFGAFLLGALVPHDSLLARELTHRLEDVVLVLFLPAFFAFTGMRTQVGLVSTAHEWAWCGVIILVACLGKIGGTAAAATLTGRTARESAALGVLMNTRGLMQLVVLSVGLDLKVITPTLFAMLVIMAIVTTIMTAPLLQMLTRSPEDVGPAGPRPTIA